MGRERGRQREGGGGGEREGIAMESASSSSLHRKKSIFFRLGDSNAEIKERKQFEYNCENQSKLHYRESLIDYKKCEQKYITDLRSSPQTLLTFTSTVTLQLKIF